MVRTEPRRAGATPRYRLGGLHWRVPVRRDQWHVFGIVGLAGRLGADYTFAST